MNDSKYILRARSTSDGIVFYSRTVQGLGLEAFYDENNNIQTRTIPTSLDEFNDFMESLYKMEKNKFSLTHIIVIDFIVLILGIIFAILLKNIGIWLSAMFFFGYSKTIFRIINLTCQIKSPKCKNYYIGKFHSAEHMICNAYETLNRIPSLEEAKNFSRFHKRCGSCSGLSYFFYIIATILWILFGFKLPTLLYFTVLLTILLLHIFDTKFKYLRWMQILVTNKPSDKELLLAIEGLKAYEEMEKIAKADFDSIMLVPPHELFRPF